MTEKIEKIIKQEYDISQLKNDMEEIKANQKEINGKLDKGFAEVTKTMLNHEGRIHAIELEKALAEKYQKDTKADTRWNITNVITLGSLAIAIAATIIAFIK